MISILFRILQAVVSLGAKMDRHHAEVLKALQSLADGQKDIRKTLEQILEALTAGQAEKITFTAYLEDGTVLEDITMLDMRDDQQATLTISPKDKKGKPALVDGVPVWASSDETVVTVVPSADGLSAVAAGVAPGSGRIVVTADADLGSGTVDLTGILEVTILAGQAASIEVTAGAPTDQ